ncbi:hypothetical protein ASPCAL09739 [Aspergillus calidoustus]|uniref:Uncharacterized protein n=1 Tax=Aspergillus calidoustus TaxID=454130 RepID=A0A0U5G4D0_ASPCI|nr:hypothetical protein ASPCAL09739 [Aspergillus calidoustus]
MKLLICSSGRKPRPPHYADLSRGQAARAYILLAVYEVGRAIYPAAHLSIGACVNYATALGLGWGRAGAGGVTSAHPEDSPWFGSGVARLSAWAREIYQEKSGRAPCIDSAQARVPGLDSQHDHGIRSSSLVCQSGLIDLN